MKHLGLTAFFSICCLLASATTYYCSPLGTGNGKTYGTPCSFSNGLSKLTTAGDTLYLEGGQYDLQTTTISGINGNASKNIVVSGYPGETVILDFRTTAYGSRGLCISSNCTYLHIKDMTLRYSGKNNLYNAGKYCTFEHLDIYGSADTGCQMKGGEHNLIKNVDSHDNFDYELDKSGTLTQCDFGGNADGFADKQFTGAGNHYVGCRSWNNSDDGWDFFQRVSNTNTMIEECICYKNGPAEYDMRNHPRYQTDKTWFDQFATAKTVTDADGNSVTVSLEHYPNMGNGNGFKMGGGYTEHNVEIHHCLAVANTVKGFDQNNDAGTMTVYNCTGYLNGNNMGFHNASYGTLYIRNCVSLSSKGGDLVTAATVAANDHNSWNMTGVTCNAADFVSLDTTQILAAREADGSLAMFDNSATANNTLLHLTAGSDLIDAGANVGLDFMGQAPDLGCFETDGTIRPSITLTSGPEEQWVAEGDSITPIVFTWAGTDNKPTSSKPTGITSKVSNTNKTVTFSGAIATADTYTITVTTNADSLNQSASATIHVRPANLRKVAFVTIPSSTEDEAMLGMLQNLDSVNVIVTSASDNTVDYSGYDAIIIGPKPSSASTGFTPLKGYDKPMLVLKPFLLKSTVWNWGTPGNTSDLEITVSDTAHPIFNGFDFSGGNTIQLFKSANTNAVTCITDWTNVSGFTSLATPASNSAADAVVDMPAGTACNGTTLTKRLIMIGISEYSTANLTNDGLQLIENALYCLLGIQETQPVTAIEEAAAEDNSAKIIFRDGQFYILREGVMYDLTGRKTR